MTTDTYRSYYTQMINNHQARKEMEKEPLVVSNKSCKTYFLLSNNTKVYFSGDFDSGNLEKAEQISEFTYRVTPGFDKTRNTTLKNFFHFKVYGFKECTVKFIITRAYILELLIKNEENNNIYKPVARKYAHQPFERIKQDINIYYNSMEEPQMSFNFTFQNQNWVEFAFAYPYSYEDSEHLIHILAEQYHKHSEIYFHQQTLIKTSETRKVHLVTITDRFNLKKERMQRVEGIFQEDQRPYKIDKPRIVISARVHPGETPASYCMEGILKFLVNEKDYRSYLLRKHFLFNIIPMVNPEGVFEGMFRNDLNGDNLNRLYLNCDDRKHKSIWGIQKWIQSLDRVDFFFDLHAHPSRKGFFIYGNAFDQFLEQIEAQIFSKMLQYNCPYFQNLDCIYSEKAMTAKDKHDSYTKQGCARVYYHKKFKMIHSYTVQCGYFAPTKLNKYPPQREVLKAIEQLCTQDWQKVSMKQYTPDSYMFMGKSLLIAILDLFHMNPYSRISTSDFKSINSLRKFTAQRVYNEVERFKLIDSNCYRKIKDVANLIQQHYYIPRFKAYGLTINQNYGMHRRKKTFSLNSRIYLQRDIQQKRSLQKLKKEKQQQEKEINLLSVPQLQSNYFREEIIQQEESKELSGIPSLPELKFSQSIPNYPEHRAAKSSSLQYLEKKKNNRLNMNEQVEDINNMLHARLKLQPPKKVQILYIKKIEMEVLNQLSRQKQKQKKDKKQKNLFDNEGVMRIERLNSFLKKQSKEKFPLIGIQSKNL